MNKFKKIDLATLAISAFLVGAYLTLCAFSGLSWIAAVMLGVVLTLGLYANSVNPPQMRNRATKVFLIAVGTVAALPLLLPLLRIGAPFGHLPYPIFLFVCLIFSASVYGLAKLLAFLEHRAQVPRS